jgi:hypothetical protein
MDDYILGYGVFNVDAADIGLTRGGGAFTVERGYKQVPADGDYGPVKGRVRKDLSVAKLVIRQLKITSADLTAMYPAMVLDTVTTPGTAEITANTDIVDADYKVVKFTGTTKSGKSIIITLTDAVNLENVDWQLLDKDEVVAELTYTATYDPADRTTEPWKIEFVD